MLQAAILAVLLIMGCGPLGGGFSPSRSSAEETVRTFYSAIEAQDREGAIGLVRAKDGSSLAATQTSALRERLAEVFQSGPIHVSGLTVTSRTSLEEDAVRLLPAGTTSTRLVFRVEGSGNGCLPLPINQATSPLALIDGRWYILEDAHFGLPLTVLSC